MGELGFPELIDLFIATYHPVVDIQHVSLHNKLYVFLALVQSRCPLELLGLGLVEIIQFFLFILEGHPHLLVSIVQLSFYRP